MNIILEYISTHWLEITAVATGVLSIFLASRQNIFTFILGIANAALFTVFYAEQHLYSASALHAIYILINVYGIFKWSGIIKKEEKKKELPVTRMPIMEIVVLLVAVLVSGLLLGLLVPEVLPKVNFPIIDATTTTASVVAQILMTRKKIETWWAWIIIDIVNGALYVVMGLWMNAALHMVYIGIAISAIVAWRKELITENKTSKI